MESLKRNYYYLQLEKQLIRQFILRFIMIFSCTVTLRDANIAIIGMIFGLTIMPYLFLGHYF